jgi:PEP-CTERM motif
MTMENNSNEIAALVERVQAGDAEALGTLLDCHRDRLTGTNQQVGALEGIGKTAVDAGADLTANHIVQSALTLGGAAGNPARATIEASDASGNPLGEPSSGFALAGSLAPIAPFGSGTALPAGPSVATGPMWSIDASVAANPSTGSAFGSASPAGNITVVPEPSSLCLIAIGSLAALAFNWRKMPALSRVRNRAFVSVRSQPSAFLVVR